MAALKRQAGDESGAFIPGSPQPGQKLVPARKSAAGLGEGFWYEEETSASSSK